MDCSVRKSNANMKDMKGKLRAISPVVAPLSDERDVPGSDKNKLWHLFNFVLHGQGYFKKRMDSYKSSVFRVNMGVKGIAICDRKGMDALIDVERVYKVPAFGRLNYNLCLLDGHQAPAGDGRAPPIGAHTPSLFCNGLPHEKQKAFTMKICQLARDARLLLTSQRVVSRYLVRWRDADAKLKQNWEQDIRAMTSDIFTESFLGVRLSANCMYNMVKGSWAKPGSKQLAKAIVAASHLKEMLNQSPKLASILSVAAESGLSEDQAIADILFMLNFNAYGGTSGVIIGCLARLQTVDPQFKEEMRKEIIKALDSADGVTYEAFDKMKKLKYFILEAIRLSPPVPVLFGNARNDFILHSDSGKFRIKKGELLVGNIYTAQRDPGLIKHDPDWFIPSRFEDDNERERLYDQMVFLNGPFKDEDQATIKNHFCPGKDIIFTVVKMVLANVIVSCDFKLTRTPIWTGKKLRRVGSPDNIVKLAGLRYFPQYPLLPRDDQDMELSDIEEAGCAVSAESLDADSNASKSQTSLANSRAIMQHVVDQWR